MKRNAHEMPNEILQKVVDDLEGAARVHDELIQAHVPIITGLQDAIMVSRMMDDALELRRVALGFRRMIQVKKDLENLSIPAIERGFGVQFKDPGPIPPDAKIHVTVITKGATHEPRH